MFKIKIKKCKLYKMEQHEFVLILKKKTMTEMYKSLNLQPVRAYMLNPSMFIKHKFIYPLKFAKSIYQCTHNFNTRESKLL